MISRATAPTWWIHGAGLVVVALAALAWTEAARAAGDDERREDERALLKALKQRHLDVDAIVLPNALSSEMKQWLDSMVPAGGGDIERLERLLDLLLSRNHLDLEYHQGHTGTAIETFESRQANCLAFTHLFVGMARQLGLPAYYLKVEDVQTFDRDGDLVVIAGHVTAGFGSPGRPRILEFAVFPTSEYRNLRQLSDLSALALFYSNRGAELLLEGDREGALEWLQTAVEIDDQLVEAWLNLGVVRRRLGFPESAESAYRRVLELAPDSSSAYRNLSAMLALQPGREEEAAQLLALTDRRENRNPFNFLELGDLSLKNGRLDDAERYYRRALNLVAVDAAEPQAAMGQLMLARGRSSRARKWLRRAQKLDPDHPRVTRLAADLDGGGGR